MHCLTTLSKQLLVLIRKKTRASALPKLIMPRKIMLHRCLAVSLCASTGNLVQHSKPTPSVLDMETGNESGLEKPATFNSAYVREAHVLSGQGNRLIVGILVVWKVLAKGCVAKCSAATVSGNVQL